MAKSDETTGQNENPIAHLNGEAIQEISYRLQEVYSSLSAMRHLSIRAQDSGESAEYCLTAISEMSRASLRGVSACVDRLEGAPTIGAHEATEFERT